MAKEKLLIAELLNANGEKAHVQIEDVVDLTTNKNLHEIIGDIESKISGLQGGEVTELKADLEALKAAFDAFMTGEDNDNDTLDRLKELVAAIQANKDNIASIIADQATKEELEAAIARLSDLEAKNWDVLDGISKDANGDLTFNGKTLNGETGIAIGTSAETATDFTGKIKIVFREVEFGADAEESVDENV